jgi:hypothetical protein
MQEPQKVFSSLRQNPWTGAANTTAIATAVAVVYVGAILNNEAC